MKLKKLVLLFAICAFIVPQLDAGPWRWAKTKAKDFYTWVKPALERILEGLAEDTEALAERKIDEFGNIVEDRVAGYVTKKVTYPDDTSINFAVFNSSGKSIGFRLFDAQTQQELEDGKIITLLPGRSHTDAIDLERSIQILWGFKDAIDGGQGALVTLSAQSEGTMYLEVSGASGELELRPVVDPDNESVIGVGYWRGTSGYTPLREDVMKKDVLVRYGLGNNIVAIKDVEKMPRATVN
jgi:hypothetical protein